MAVTLTQLAAALRLGDGENPPTEPVAGLITRLLGVSQAFVARAAPEAPDAIADEATIRMTAYLYDAPTAAAGGRYAQAWRNSGAEALVSRWVVRRAGSEGEGVPAGGPSTGGLDDAQVRAIVDEVLAAHTDVETAHHVPPTGAQDSVDDTVNRAIAAAGHASNTDLSAADQAIQRNANALVTHEATPHGGGNGGTPATPTPPVVLVDGALYSAYGDITIPGWRGYDFFQLLFTNGADTYQSEPINSAQLIARSPIVVSMSRNVGWRLTIDATDDDVITIASTGGNTIAAPTATSAMTVIGWFAGTVVDGGGGGDGTDQTARDAAAANTAAATAHAADANAHHTPPTGGEGGGAGGYTRLHGSAVFQPAAARTMRDSGYAVADLPDMFLVCFHIGAPGHFSWILKADLLTVTSRAPDAIGSAAHYVRSGAYNDIQSYVGRTTGGNLSCGISSEPSSFSIVIGSFG